MKVKNAKHWIVAVTGASGMKYALRLLDVLEQEGIELHVVVSEAGTRVLREEEGIRFSLRAGNLKSLIGRDSDHVYFYDPADIGAAIASGSMLFEGMVIVPCSMGSLGAIAHGLSQNLIHRAADVTLKERRNLILVPREAPLSVIHLENMLILGRAGASIIPAMPGFYQQPQNLSELVDGFVMKILDHMQIENALRQRWDERKELSSPSLHLEPELLQINSRESR